MSEFADRLTAIIESRMSHDLAWTEDDGTTVSRFTPEQVGWALAHLYLTGDTVSGLPPLADPPPLLPDDDTAVERLRAAGFEPDFNVCAGCHHHGSRHDLNNRCMDCIEQVDDYFTAMTEDEKWAWGIAALREGGQR